MTCSKCNSNNMTLCSGVSKKNGKPWKGNKCGDCGNMDFLQLNEREKDAPIRDTTYQPKTTSRGTNEKAMFYSYAKDLVIAIIDKIDSISMGDLQNMVDEAGDKTNYLARKLWIDYTSRV